MAINHELAAQKFGLEPFHEQTPETVFRIHWALALLKQVRQSNRAEFVLGGKEQQYDLLQVFLTRQSGEPSYRDVAPALDKSEGAIKVAVHRLRRQFHNQIRLEIAKTVASDSEINEEFNEPFDALCS